jgi:galactose mutarotase-like enzyme
MPNHGIARSSEFTLKSACKEQITLSLVSNEKTKESYPFDFIFDITFKVTDSTLEVSYNVKNEDEKELIFALGGHPFGNRRTRPAVVDLPPSKSQKTAPKM